MPITPLPNAFTFSNYWNGLKKIIDKINEIIAGGGGIPDAPSDGTLYGRKNAAWDAVPAPGIADAPSDGTLYARKNAAWDAVPAGVEEAPNDGLPYVRQSQNWEIGLRGVQQLDRGLQAAVGTVTITNAYNLLPKIIWLQFYDNTNNGFYVKVEIINENIPAAFANNPRVETRNKSGILNSILFGDCTAAIASLAGAGTDQFTVVANNAQANGSFDLVFSTSGTYPGVQYNVYALF